MPGIAVVAQNSKKILDLIENYFGASVNSLLVIFYIFKNALHAKVPALLSSTFVHCAKAHCAKAHCALDTQHLFLCFIQKLINLQLQSR